ncbi:hypothetical protein BH23GEM6_BH23GEM6_11900 [soil metagenome]
MTSASASLTPALTDRFFRQMIESLPLVTFVMAAGPSEQVLYVSPQIEPLLGIFPEQWLSNPRILLDLLHEEDLGRVLREQANARFMGEPFQAEYRLLSASGRVVWVDHRTKPLVIAGGDPLWMGTLQDITARKHVENELRSLAYLDELTGLYNRRGFLKVAEQQLRLTQRNARGAVLMFLDINSLQSINDNIGHHAGDRVLLEVVELLRRSFRDTDIIGRAGGDEFAIWAVETDGNRGDVLRNRILERVEALNEEPDRESLIQLSIGYSFCEPSEQVTVETLMQRADIDMFAQKKTRTIM